MVSCRCFYANQASTATVNLIFYICIGNEKILFTTTTKSGEIYLYAFYCEIVRIRRQLIDCYYVLFTSTTGVNIVDKYYRQPKNRFNLPFKKIPHMIIKCEHRVEDYFILGDDQLFHLLHKRGSDEDDSTHNHHHDHHLSNTNVNMNTSMNQNANAEGSVVLVDDNAVVVVVSKEDCIELLRFGKPLEKY